MSLMALTVSRLRLSCIACLAQSPESVDIRLHSSAKGTDQVGIVRMPFHPASDKRAEGAHVQAARTRIIEGVSGNCAAYPLTLTLLCHHSVQKDDRVGCELVLGDADERSVDPRLIAACHCVVGDYHGHSCPLCQSRRMPIEEGCRPVDVALCRDDDQFHAEVAA